MSNTLALAFSANRLINHPSGCFAVFASGMGRKTRRSRAGVQRRTASGFNAELCFIPPQKPAWVQFPNGYPTKSVPVIVDTEFMNIAILRVEEGVCDIQVIVKPLLF